MADEPQIFKTSGKEELTPTLSDDDDFSVNIKPNHTIITALKTHTTRKNIKITWSKTKKVREYPFQRCYVAEDANSVSESAHEYLPYNSCYEDDDPSSVESKFANDYLTQSYHKDEDEDEDVDIDWAEGVSDDLVPFESDDESMDRYAVNDTTFFSTLQSSLILKFSSYSLLEGLGWLCLSIGLGIVAASTFGVIPIIIGGVSTVKIGVATLTAGSVLLCGFFGKKCIDNIEPRGQYSAYSSSAQIGHKRH